MKATTVSSILLLAATTVKAHYYFPWLIVNGTQSLQWKYVRKTRPDPYQSTKTADLAQPLRDLFSTNFTCGRSAWESMTTTETADVVAGSEIGFRINQGIVAEPNANQSGLEHPGPGLAYLARAPNDDLTTFSGIDGNWFKIAELLGKSDNEWKLHSYEQHKRHHPPRYPPGKYLLRFEHIYLQPSFYIGSQFFLNCAQINVLPPSAPNSTSTGEGKAGSASLEDYPYAKFPGAYDYMDPGIYIGENIYTEGLLRYVAPGPPLWKP
ncbi:lytic polysaccharide monooxygenase [Lophiostoma macrostomum CBS 122681]|uniref:lytic cellulose monooxygenase (C4-dehydrogenating) n=1 Tax=Lophiostoma macrostomum CBS 122681 TaxID=1314788 RepID=A0A6A6TCI6_9PLEO|nr:lytic polysaccharide monooxygenase [Lophiostoma macrostomum CBS 122681]